MNGGVGIKPLKMISNLCTMKNKFKVCCLLFCFLVIHFYSIGRDKNEKETILLHYSTKQVFSDDIMPDSFSIKLVGSTLLKATVYFQIFNHQQKIIYRDSFPSIYLLDYTIENDNPLTKKESYIKKRMKEFFSKQNFRLPAIGKNEKFDTDYTQILKSTWNEIQADPKRNGFYYYTDGENGKTIAFSKKLKKVVVYRACC